MRPTKRVEEVKNVVMDLQRVAILFSLRIGQWRIRKNADRSRVETTADKRLVNVRKRIIDSDEYRAIVAADTEAREMVMKQSLPSPLGRGVYMLPIELVRGLMEWLTAYQARRGDLIDAFVKVYPTQKSEMKKALGDMWDEDDYPHEDEVRAKFWVSTLMMELNAPKALEAISGQMYQDEMRRLRNVWAETEEKIVSALYSEMNELVGGLAERLDVRDGKGEKTKVVRDSVVEEFHGWLNLFDARNLTRDQRLAAIVGRARDVVNGVTGKTIRDNVAFRKELATEFKTLRANLERAIIDRPKRKIRLDDDE